MTERDWLASTEPERMLKFLAGRVSTRKLRLFAVACCHRVWHLLRDRRSRQAVVTAERYADGLASEQELEAARNAAWAAVEEWQQQARRTRTSTALLRARQAAWATAGNPKRAARWAARAAGLIEAAAVRKQARAQLVGTWGTGLAAVPLELMPATWQALSLPAWWAVQAEEAQAHDARVAQEAVERCRQSELLRELLGNPFRPVVLDPAWLMGPGADAVRVARAIADEGAFDQSPIVADALEEAGCVDEPLLGHLRGTGPHLRGCWALDLIARSEFSCGP